MKSFYSIIHLEIQIMYKEEEKIGDICTNL